MSKRKTPGVEDELSRLVERELTALARDGKLPPAHGVDAAVTEVLGLLSRGDKHPLLAGEAGVGKSAIVHEVARKLVADDDSRLVEISMAGILARGERRAAETLDELLESLAGVPRTIVYIRDLASGLGGPVIPVMIKALRAGALRFVLEADQRRAHELLRSDEAVAERLHLLAIDEPPPERVRWILGKVAEDLESELGVPIEPSACDMAQRMAAKFLLAQRMPRKAIELLRETAAEAITAKRERVGPDEVVTRFCSATRLPRFVVDDSVPLDLAETERFFGDRILGQQDAVAVVLRAVALLKAGLNDPRRPLGVFLFAGPTGVGKTHLAKLLAEFLFGSADRLVRLNMADYPDENDDTIPFGAPWAESWQQRRGELTRLLDGKVFSVLLLDEFEKAHQSVHDRFLQLFDEGQFVNAAGEVVPCNNTLIIATSNVGAEVYREPPIGFSGSRGPQELRVEVDRRIAEAFRPEFLNRFDALCHFQPLSRVEIRKIAHREVGRVLEREGIRARGLDVEVTPDVVDLLVERGYSPLSGARFLQREIEKTLTAALAVEIVKRPLPPGTPVRVEARPGGRVVAVSSPAPVRERTTQVTVPSPGAARIRKRVDRRALQTEADGLLNRATQVGTAVGRPGLERRRAQLLAESQAPDFWDDPERAASKLRDFRTVEAQLGDLERLVQTAQFARRLVREAKNEGALGSAARAVEEVGREVQLAEARTQGGGGSGIDEALLEILAASEGPAAKGWIRELGYMYLGWAQKRGYEALAVAEGSDPARVLLRIAGPGVLGYLASEAGLHRRVDESSRIGAYVHSRPWPREPPGTVEVEAREIRRHAGFFVERVGAEARAKDDTSGRQVVLQGIGELAEARQLAAALLDGPPPTGEVRRYFVGRAARVEDPRTGAETPRIKDVLRGELELFIAAWLSKDRA